MKILLIQPPIRDFYCTHGRTEPLGLAYIDASLQAAGHEVLLLDAMASRERQPLPIPPEMRYMEFHYPPDDLSPLRLFSQFQHFGLSFQEIAERAARYQPALVGISANFTPYEAESLECAEIIKEQLPSAKIVLGGHHATIQHTELMQHPFIDYVIRGEGERSMTLLADALSTPIESPSSPNPSGEQATLHKIPGLVFRDPEGRLVENPLASPIEPLESLSKPMRSFSTPTVMILTSRGCPRRCRFCSIAHVMGHQLRLRSIPDILDEVQENINHGARHIDFEDDNMNWNKTRMFELMDGLATRFQGGAGVPACEFAREKTTGTIRTTRTTTSNEAPIRFSAQNGLVAEKLDAQILQRMVDAGFDRVNLAVVSANAALQKELTRNQPIAQFEKTVHLARASGLKVTAYLILGLPTDTLDDMIRNILWLTRLPVEIGPSIFYPVPGTPLFDLCVSKSYINPANKRTFRSSAYPVETENFSRKDLVTLMRICRLLNYLKSDEPLSASAIQQCQSIAQSLTAEIQETATSNPGPHDKTSSPVRQLTTNHRLDRETIGNYLIHRFMETGNLLGLRFRKRRKSPYVYEEIGYPASDRVTEPFLQALQELARIGEPQCC